MNRRRAASVILVRAGGVHRAWRSQGYFVYGVNAMFSQDDSQGRNGGTAWLRGLARPAALAGVVAAGLCTGYLAGRLVANEDRPPPTYCSFNYTGPAIPCVGIIKVLSTGQMYVRVPYPPAAAPCNTGSAANYVNTECPGANTNGGNFSNITDECGSRLSPAGFE